MDVTVDADKMHYRVLNETVKGLLQQEDDAIIIENVNGQRYIGNALQGNQKIMINGLPGNDLAVFIDGPTLIVNGNIQDGAANTMNSGLIIVHGSAGDTLGYGMRGGEVYIRDNTGYRAGIHMKEYAEQKPVVVIGGTAGDFMGEYMAGGVMVVLNLNHEKQPIGDYCATGMHGGVIYIRGEVDSHLIKGGSVCQPDVNELKLLDKYITNYKNYFNKEVPPVKVDDFVKIMPGNKRQYGNLYIGI